MGRDSKQSTRKTDVERPLPVLLELRRALVAAAAARPGADGERWTRRRSVTDRLRSGT